MTQISPRPVTKIKHFNSRIWRSGKAIGKIKGEISVDLPPLVHQSLFGLMTENGLVKSENTLIAMSENTPKLFDKGRELDTLAKHAKNLEEFVSRYYEQLKKGAAKSETETQIFGVFHDIRQLMSQKPIGRYTKQIDLCTAQILYIKIATFIIEYSSQLDDDMLKAAFEIAKMIMDRRELDLEHLAFDHSATASFPSSPKADTSPAHKSEKLNVAHAYHSFLIGCLKSVLGSIGQKGIDSYIRNFVLYCLSYCYFRLVPYQRVMQGIFEDVVASAGHKEDWRKFYCGPQEFFKVTSRSRKASAKLDNINHLPPEVSSMFDWETHFFSQIEKEPAYRDNMNSLDELIKDQDWKASFAKRGTGFFYFVVEASFYLKENLGESLLEKIDFLDIPGYQILISTFIHELRSREVRNYPDALVYALVNTIEVNPKLLAPYFQIISHKTK